MQIISSKKVKTRKEHICVGCNRKFPKKSKLTVNKFADYGEISSAYWCNVCIKYFDRYMEENDFFLEGELKSEGKENWEETRKEVEYNNYESSN